MSFRFRKSIGLGKGLRLNLSKTGVGISSGIPGMRYSVHSSGRTVRTVGVPGTGMYFRKDTYAKKGTRSTTRSSMRTPPPAPVPVFPKAGLLAPRGEKSFVQGVRSFMQGKYSDALPLFVDASARDAQGRTVGEEFLAGMCLAALERNDEAIPYLETVMASNQTIPDALMGKYGVGGEMVVNVTPAVSVRVPMSNLAVALMLAEVYQLAGKTQKATDLLESLGSLAPHDPVFALSLADLYSEARQYDDVIRVTEGFESNQSDVTLQVILFRASALLERGMADGALLLTKEALRSKKREAVLLRMARYIRGLAYEKAGKAGMARREFEKVYAEDAWFADVAKRLGTA